MLSIQIYDLNKPGQAPRSIQYDDSLLLKEIIEKAKSLKNNNQRGMYLFLYVETQYAVVRLVSKRLKWSLTTEPISSLNFDICWIDGHCRQ